VPSIEALPYQWLCNRQCHFAPQQLKANSQKWQTESRNERGHFVRVADHIKIGVPQTNFAPSRES
jgi:hypothetical protein